MTSEASWSEPRVEQLKKLWEAGLSASQIACELGNVTRNAVIGKVHRLGLSGKAKSPSKPRAPRPPRDRIVRLRPVARGNSALAEVFAVEAEPEPFIDNVIPFAQRVSLSELTEANCHWPVGDPATPDFHFCGGKAVAGYSYCPHHSRVAYQPASQRRSRSRLVENSRNGAWV